MAVLEKIRVKLGILISILIAIALLSFIIDPNTLGSTLQSMSKDNNVGQMKGKAVTYRDYFTAVEQNTALMQALNGSNSNTEESQKQLRDMTWNQFYNQRVFFPKINDAGFYVEDAEMVDLLQGDNPSPVIAQQRMFMDESGRFSPEAVKDFVSQMDLDESGFCIADESCTTKTPGLFVAGDCRRKAVRQLTTAAADGAVAALAACAWLER